MEYFSDKWKRGVKCLKGMTRCEKQGVNLGGLVAGREMEKKTRFCNNNSRGNNWH